MYKKIEIYNWCIIYKNIDGGIYVAKFDNDVISTGSYLKVKNDVLKFWDNILQR